MARKNANAKGTPRRKQNKKPAKSKPPPVSRVRRVRRGAATRR